MLVAASTAAAPAFAQVSVNINIGPPAQQYEMVPVMTPGYVWAPGYWAWHGDHYIWVRGRTMVQRVGYRWEPDRWEQRGANYYRQAGRWEHDANYKVVKVKKEKNPKHANNGGGNKGKQGKGHKNEH